MFWVSYFPSNMRTFVTCIVCLLCDTHTHTHTFLLLVVTLMFVIETIAFTICKAPWTKRTSSMEPPPRKAIKSRHVLEFSRPRVFRKSPEPLEPTFYSSVAKSLVSRKAVLGERWAFVPEAWLPLFALSDSIPTS